MGVINLMHKALHNFWFALVMAMCIMFGAFVCYRAGNTGGVIVNVVAAVYWWVVAWLNRKPAVTEYNLGDDDFTQEDLEVITQIRDDMTKLIAKHKAELDAKEKHDKV